MKNFKVKFRLNASENLKLRYIRNNSVCTLEKKKEGQGTYRNKYLKIIHEGDILDSVVNLPSTLLRINISRFHRTR